MNYLLESRLEPLHSSFADLLHPRFTGSTVLELLRATLASAPHAHPSAPSVDLWPWQLVLALSVCTFDSERRGDQTVTLGPIVAWCEALDRALSSIRRHRGEETRDTLMWRRLADLWPTQPLTQARLVAETEVYLVSRQRQELSAALAADSQSLVATHELGRALERAVLFPLNELSQDLLAHQPYSKPAFNSLRKSGGGGGDDDDDDDEDPDTETRVALTLPVPQHLSVAALLTALQTDFTAYLLSPHKRDSDWKGDVPFLVDAVGTPDLTSISECKSVGAGSEPVRWTVYIYSPIAPLTGWLTERRWAEPATQVLVQDLFQSHPHLALQPLLSAFGAPETRVLASAYTSAEPGIRAIARVLVKWLEARTSDYERWFEDAHSRNALFGFVSYLRYRLGLAPNMRLALLRSRRSQSMSTAHVSYNAVAAHAQQAARLYCSKRVSQEPLRSSTDLVRLLRAVQAARPLAASSDPEPGSVSPHVLIEGAALLQCVEIMEKNACVQEYNGEKLIQALCIFHPYTEEVVPTAVPETTETPKHGENPLVELLAIWKFRLQYHKPSSRKRKMRETDALLIPADHPLSGETPERPAKRPHVDNKEYPEWLYVCMRHSLDDMRRVVRRTEHELHALGLNSRGLSVIHSQPHRTARICYVWLVSRDILHRLRANYANLCQTYDRSQRHGRRPFVTLFERPKDLSRHALSVYASVHGPPRASTLYTF